MELQERPREMEQLEPLVGTWTADAADPASAVWTFRRAADEHVLIAEFVHREPGSALRGHAVIAYDVRRGAFALLWLDNLGHVPEQPTFGNLDGDNLVFDGDDVRLELVPGADTLAFRLAMKPDDGAAELVVEGTCHKTLPHEAHALM